MDRNLDLKIAKEIFGWNTYEKVGKDYDGQNGGEVLVPYKGYLDSLFKEGYTLPPKGKIAEGFFVPSYTRDLQSAMEVVRKVKLPMPAHELPSNPVNLCSLAYNHFKNPKNG